MKLNICVFDFETDGPDQNTCEPVQLASQMIHPITLEVIEGSQFSSFMRPEGIEAEDYKEEHWGTIRWHAGNYTENWSDLSAEKQDEAAEGIYQKWLEAPPQKEVWKVFCEYLKKYNNADAGKKKTRFWAPIRGGINIRRFDNIIVDRLCERFKMLTKEGEQKIFYPRDVVDIQELAFYWFEGLSEPEAYNMDALREFFGMPTWGAHDAMNDVIDETKVIQRFLRLHRSIAPKVHFKNCMKEREPAAQGT